MKTPMLDGIVKVAYGTGGFDMSTDSEGNPGLFYYQRETSAGNHPDSTPWFSPRIPKKYIDAIKQSRTSDAYEAEVFVPLKHADKEDLAEAMKERERG